MIEITEHTIDIKNILVSKLGEKMKYVPKFLVNWFKRIAHEDDINKSYGTTKDAKATIGWKESSITST